MTCSVCDRIKSYLYRKNGLHANVAYTDIKMFQRKTLNLGDVPLYTTTDRH